MRSHKRDCRRGFTMVEMLVVIGIIVVLVALLIPAASIAVSTTRNASMSFEIAEMQKAIETYKQQKGDYPPSFGEIDANGNSLYLSAPYTSVLEKHLRKCYPKMTQDEKINFLANVAPQIAQAEALWFWLARTQNDERQPFFSNAGNFKQYFPFAQDRLVFTRTLTWTYKNQPFAMDLYAYKPRYAKQTPYVYLDSRTYLVHSVAARAAPFIPPAAANNVQPYGDFARAQEIIALNQSNPPTNQTEIDRRKRYQYMNPDTFQIICAGQDGEFGAAYDQFNNVSNATGLKLFKQGYGYTDEDKDNLTNFSEGKRLGDHIGT